MNTIPKLIHYVWLNENPLPAKFEKNVESWTHYMPDFAVMPLTLENVPDIAFVNEAIKRKKWAAASNYLRIYRLFHFGGIYFDVDVEAVKTLNPLRALDFFAASEKPWRVNCAVIGSVKMHKFLELCLNYMDDYRWDKIGPQGVEIETGPQMFTDIAKNIWGWSEADRTQWLDGGVTIFDSSYFYPYYFDEVFTPECIKPWTFTVHHWAKEW